MRHDGNKGQHWKHPQTPCENKINGNEAQESNMFQYLYDREHRYRTSATFAPLYGLISSFVEPVAALALDARMTWRGGGLRPTVVE